MIKNIAAGAALALALGGCTLLQPEEKLPAPAQPEAQGVELTKEQGGRFIAFVGPKAQHTEVFLGVGDTNYFCLRSWLDNKTGETAHQLYVADSYYGGPYRWDKAHDQDNKPLRYIPISRNEITCEKGCAYFDEFAAALPEDYLRAHAAGFSVTFSASNGKTLSVAVSANQAVAELAAIDTVRATIAKAAANPPTPPPAATPSSAPAPAPTASAATPAVIIPPATATSTLAPGTVVPAPAPPPSNR